ncbi:MAG: metal-dependent hydrolase [Pseudomonadales bacterium]|nr:metal-dependent hydrolase [Pseudomonadales bacterium]
MPFTPFHMGPGLLLKSILQGAFSLMVFGWAQIVMDVQPLIVLISGEGHLHGFSHTYVGATLLAIFSIVTGKYLSELGLKILGFRESTIAWWVVVLSAFLGTYSHVLLDSIMHSDVQPFYPFNLDNPFLRWISVGMLHKVCIYSGVLGAAIYGIIFIFHKVKKRPK